MSEVTGAYRRAVSAEIHRHEGHRDTPVGPHVRPSGRRLLRDRNRRFRRPTLAHDPTSRILIEPSWTKLQSFLYDEVASMSLHLTLGSTALSMDSSLRAGSGRQS